MKKKFVLLFIMNLFLCLSISAKDLKTIVFTTQPKMQCQNCEKKIKGNLRFVKGVKRIDTNVKEQRVTVVYDADTVSPEELIRSFGKFGYKVTVVRPSTK